MTSSTAMHHVGVVVQDIEASAAWYAEILGFERLQEFGWPGVRAVFIVRGGARLELIQNASADPMVADRSLGDSNLKIGGINHFAIKVADLDAILTELQAKCVGIVSPPREVPGSGGSRFAFIHDNERMLVELFQPA